VAALGLHYSAYTSEVYRAGIDSVPRGQWEAAIALNLSPYRTFRSIILPQAIPPILPALGNYLVAMFKDTPLLAAITVNELLQSAKLIGAERFRYLEPLTMVGLLFLVASLASAHFIRILEARVAAR
jgi:polar amino acid transport system permease protein